MKLVYGFSKITRSMTNGVLTIGKFDGLHLGHRKIISTVVKEAKRRHAVPVALTFRVPPGKLKRKNILSESEKLEILGRWGIQYAILAKFTPSFANLSPSDFIHKILMKKLKIKELVVGSDFRFGKGRTGDKAFLSRSCRKEGILIREVPSQRYRGKQISSSLVRKLIESGRVKEVPHYLGRYWSVRGKVVKGSSLGKETGFPTANLLPSPNVILPSGVFLIRAETGKRFYWGVANSGLCPTLKERRKPILEAHLLSYRGGPLYGNIVRVHFLKKIRDEMKFSSVKELAVQIKKDIFWAKRRAGKNRE